MILLYLTYCFTTGSRTFFYYRRTKRPVKWPEFLDLLCVSHNHIPFNRFYDWRCNNTAEKCLLCKMDAFLPSKKLYCFFCEHEAEKRHGSCMCLIKKHRNVCEFSPSWMLVTSSSFSGLLCVVTLGVNSAIYRPDYKSQKAGAYCTHFHAQSRQCMNR